MAKERHLMSQSSNDTPQKNAKATAGDTAGDTTETTVTAPPMAEAAQMKPRHWGLLLSFLALVLLPILLSGWYLWMRADDQYASTVGFTVRKEGGSSAADIFGIASQITGGSTQSDTDILFEYLQNQNIVEAIDTEIDLVAHYAQNHAHNPLFSLPEDANLEEKVAFWSKIARIAYDRAAGLIEVQILAFDADTAQAIAQSVLRNCQELINKLNATARQDKIKYAQEDLTLAVERLRKSREDLILFRTKNKIVDLEADLQGRLGVVNTLQQQLAEALVEADLLAINTSGSDPRVVQSTNLINVIRARIEAEKANVISGNTDVIGDDYPTLLAEYEGLVVNREYAEQSYRAALAALDVARADASRQSSYLAAHLEPTFPQSAQYPQRLTLLGLVALFITMGWTILVLIYYSIRDSR